MIKATGVVRRVDDLGRIVIPRELRKVYSMDSGVPVEFLAGDDGILLRPYVRGCIFCGEAGNIKDFKGRPVCAACRANLASEPLKQAL